MDNQIKQWIDTATYHQLLYKNRFGKSEELIFQGELGEYFMDALKKKGNELSSGKKVSISKSIGWENN